MKNWSRRTIAVQRQNLNLNCLIQAYSVTTATLMCLSNTPRPTGTIFVSELQWQIAAPQAAEIYLLPTLWFRNTWSWAAKPKPALALDKSTGTILAHESEIGDYRLCYAEGGTPCSPKMKPTANCSSAQKMLRLM